MYCSFLLQHTKLLQQRHAVLRSLLIQIQAAAFRLIIIMIICYKERRIRMTVSLPAMPVLYPLDFYFANGYNFYHDINFENIIGGQYGTADNEIFSRRQSGPVSFGAAVIDRPLFSYV